MENRIFSQYELGLKMIFLKKQTQLFHNVKNVKSFFTMQKVPGEKFFITVRTKGPSLFIVGSLSAPLKGLKAKTK